MIRKKTFSNTSGTAIAFLHQYVAVTIEDLITLRPRKVSCMILAHTLPLLNPVPTTASDQEDLPAASHQKKRKNKKVFQPPNSV